MAKKIVAVEVDEEAGVEDLSALKPSTNKGISKIDLAMRVIAAIATLGSAIALATTNQSTTPIMLQFTDLRARFRDFPTFTFFMVINCIACSYLVLSLVLSLLHIFKSVIKITRLILIILDTVIMACLTAGASAAAAVVQLADKGNTQANWVAVCQHNSFCERVTGSLVGSFLAILLLLMLIIFSAIAISRS